MNAPSISDASTPMALPGSGPLGASPFGSAAPAAAHQATDAATQPSFAQAVANALSTMAGTISVTLTPSLGNSPAKTDLASPPISTSGKTKPSAQDTSADPNAANLAANLLPANLVAMLHSPAVPVSLDSNKEAASFPATSSCSSADSNSSPCASFTSAANNAAADPATSSPTISGNLDQLPGLNLAANAATALESSSANGWPAAENPGSNSKPVVNSQASSEPVSATPAGASAKDAHLPTMQPSVDPTSGASAALPQAVSQPHSAGATPEFPAASQAQPLQSAQTQSSHSAPSNELTQVAKVVTAPPFSEHLNASVLSSSSTQFTLASSQHPSGVAQPAKLEAAADRSSSQDHASNQGNQNRSDLSTALNSVSVTGSSHDSPDFSAAVLAGAAKAEPGQSSPAPVNLPTAPAMSSERPANSAAIPQDAAVPAHSSTSLFPTEALPNRFVNTAQLLATSGHSEMRIAMDSDKLGPVELRARLVGDQLGASIVVEKRDAHAALAAELPALQQALNDKMLRVDHVALLHGTSSSTAQDGGSAAKQDQPNASNSKAASAMPWSSNGAFSSIAASAEPKGIFDSRGRLSVHA